MKPELINVVKKLKELDNKAELYLKTIPPEFYSIVFDNEYSSNSGMKSDVLIRALFGENSEDIFWFLYEWKPGKKNVQITFSDGREFVIETEEDYYKYLETV